MLIYNFPPTFTGRVNSAFEQSYLFKSDVDYVIAENTNYVDDDKINVFYL